MRPHSLILALTLCGVGAAGAVSAACPECTRVAAAYGAGSGAARARVRTRRSAGRQARRVCPAYDRHGRQPRAAPPFGCSTSTSATPRPVRLTDLGCQLELARMERRRAVSLLPVESQRLDPSVAARIGPPGGEPTQVTSAAARCRLLPRAPKGDRVFVSVEVFRDCPTLACTKAAARHRGARAEAARRALRPASSCVTGIRGATAAARSSSRSRSSPSGTAGGDAGQSHRRTRRRRAGEALRRPRGLRDQSRTGRPVAFSIRARARRASPGRPISTSTSCPPAGGTPRNLTADNPAWDAQPAFSPDGATPRVPRHGSAGIRVRPLSSRAPRSAERREASAHPELGPLDRELRLVARRQNPVRDHRSSRPASSVGDRRSHRQSFRDHRRRRCRGVQRRPASECIYAQSDLADPADLYSIGFDGGKPTQLTHLNQTLTRRRARLGEYQQFNFTGANGDNVFGYVVKPAEFQTRPDLPGGAADSRRTRGQHGERLALALECADLRGRRIRRGDDRFPRIDRLRPGLHRRDQRRLGRQAARGS